MNIILSILEHWGYLTIGAIGMLCLLGILGFTLEKYRDYKLVKKCRDQAQTIQEGNKIARKSNMVISLLLTGVTKTIAIIDENYDTRKGTWEDRYYERIVSIEEVLKTVLRSINLLMKEKVKP